MLLTDAAKQGKRTFKFLQALVAGVWIVSFDCAFVALSRGSWSGLARRASLVGPAGLTAAAAAGRWLPEAPYEVQADSHHVAGSPAVARLNRWARLPPLLDGFSFYFSGTFAAPSPSRDELVALAEAAGGKVTPTRARLPPLWRLVCVWFFLPLPSP